MSETVTDIEQLKQEVEGLVGPFFDKYNGLDAEIKKREKKIEEIKQEMKELRDARSYLRTIVRNINPDLIPSIHKNGNGRKKKSTGGNKYSPETLQAATEWAQARRDELNGMNEGQGFRPVDIFERDDWTILKSQSTIHKLFVDMHETAGVLALNKWVRGRPYGNVKTGKFYKVV